MKEAKHSPGPWNVYPSTESHSFYLVFDEDDNNLTTSDDVHAANARLIAAAPDLLASLSELVDSPNAKSNAMWDRARAAIKAVGTTAAILLALTLFATPAHACVGQDSLRAHLEQVAVKLQAMAAKPDFNNAEEALRLFADRDATERAIAKGCGAETKTADNR